jgi:hypothetical protein
VSGALTAREPTDGTGLNREAVAANRVPVVTFALQFRGHATPLSPGVVIARATAPSCALVGQIDADGLHGSLEPRAGGEAHLECRLTFLDAERFEEAGTISFGSGNTLRFRSGGHGSLVPSPSAGLRHGTVVCDVDDGAGTFLGVTGRIVSSFLVSETGDLTDNHLGLLFLDVSPRQHRGKVE